MDKTSMYKLTYGLFVITARDGSKDNGCITNTVGQVTTTPNRISLTVNKTNFTHDMIIKTGIFNVSILSCDATFELFQRFGFFSGKDTDKFAGFTDYARATNGLLYVTKGVNAMLSAKVVQSIDLGTHTMFIADVTDGLVLSDASSATYAYYQSEIKPKPQENPKKTIWRCKVCGYEYEGEELPADFICPLCKHGADDFEKIEV